MINGVSFGAQDLNSLIAEPPANARAKTSAAAGITDPINDRFEKSGSKGKKVLKTVVSLAIIAAALAALRSKVGGLKTINLDTGLGEQKGVMAKGKYIIAKAGQYVIDGFNYIKGKIPFLSKNNDTAAKVEKAAEAVTETSTNA